MGRPVGSSVRRGVQMAGLGQQDQPSGTGHTVQETSQVFGADQELDDGTPVLLCWGLDLCEPLEFGESDLRRQEEPV